MRRDILLTASVILLIGGFYLATLRPGQDWGDDFGLYLAHARNLVEGRPYDDTGYVYNRHNPSVAPRTYPPVYPLLLAPVYAAFGLNLTAMKVFNAILFMGFLTVLAVGARRKLSLRATLGVLLFVGLNPFLWELKDRLLSEVAFLLFAYLALLLMQLASEPERGRRAGLWLGLLAGLAAALAFGTRTVGVALVPGWLVQQVIRRRGLPGLPALAGTACFVLGVLLQKALFPTDVSYGDQLVLDGWLYLGNVGMLFKMMGGFLSNGYLGAGNWLVVGLVGVLTGVGIASRVSRGTTVDEWFTLFSVLLLVIWPYAGNPRYLVPLFPLLALYTVEGLAVLRNSRFQRAALPATVALGLTVLASYAGRYSRLDFGPIREGPCTPDAEALFDFARTHTTADDLFLFSKPKAFALFTGRRAAAHDAPDDAAMWDYVREAGVTHVVVCRGFRASASVLGELVDRRRDAFTEVYRNDQFTVYRLVSSPSGTSLSSRP